MDGWDDTGPAWYICQRRELGLIKLDGWAG
jgi:hypothetical protein